jgi:hypothetical protein
MILRRRTIGSKPLGRHDGFDRAVAVGLIRSKPKRAAPPRHLACAWMCWQPVLKPKSIWHSQLPPRVAPTR